MQAWIKFTAVSIEVLSMAAAKQKEFIDKFKAEFLTCSLCNEPYDNSYRSRKEPKGLRCLHTFCLSCLEERENDRRHFDCPACGEEHKLPKNSWKKVKDVLPDNFNVHTITKFLDVHETFYGFHYGVVKPCSFCTAVGISYSTKAINYCWTCNRRLCQSCSVNHAEDKSFNCNLETTNTCSNPDVTELPESSHSSAGMQQQREVQSVIDVKKCTLELNANPPTANKAGLYQAILYTVNNQDQLLTTGGANVQVTQHISTGKKMRCDVVDNTDGTYTIMYWASRNFSLNTDGQQSNLGIQPSWNHDLTRTSQQSFSGFQPSGNLGLTRASQQSNPGIQPCLPWATPNQQSNPGIQPSRNLGLNDGQHQSNRLSVSINGIAAMTVDLDCR